MNSFEAELERLVEKYREFPGTDLHEMLTTLHKAASSVYFEMMERGMVPEFPDFESQ